MRLISQTTGIHEFACASNETRDERKFRMTNLLQSGVCVDIMLIVCAIYIDKEIIMPGAHAFTHTKQILQKVFQCKKNTVCV